MDKIKSFVSEYGLMIALGLIIILFFRTCGMNRDADKIKKEIKTLKIDIEYIKKNLATKKDIENQMENVGASHSLICFIKSLGSNSGIFSIFFSKLKRASFNLLLKLTGS